MRAWAVILSVVYATSTAAEGLRVLRGRVVEARSEVPIAGAQITSAKRKPVQSDQDGVFLMPLAGSGQKITVNHPGYRAAEVWANNDEMTVRLSSDESDDEVIEIYQDALPTAKAKTVELTADDIRKIPGAGNDVLKAVQSLPGVARTPYGMGGLVLRGSSPRDSSVYLDGVKVPLLYHFGGLRSFYPSALIDTVDVQPGSFGANYGRSQGGLVSVSSRTARDDEWRWSGEISLIDASATAEGPAPGGAVFLGMRRSYFDAILDAVLPEDSGFSLTLAPRYYDGQVRYDIDIGPRRSLSLFLFGSDDRLKFVNPSGTGEDAFDYRSAFARLGANLRFQLGTAQLQVTPWLGFDHVSLRVTEQGITRTSQPMGLRTEISTGIGGGAIEGGLEIYGGRFGFNVNNQPPPQGGGELMAGATQRDGSRWTADVAGWVEPTLYFLDSKVAIRPAVRVERYGISSQWTLDPRLSLNQKIGPRLTLRQAVGIYHQPASLAELDPVWGNPHLRASYSRQWSAGFDLNVAEGLELSVTGFYHELEDLPVDAVTSATPSAGGGQPTSGGAGSFSRELTSGSFGSYSYLVNTGKGEAYGIETVLNFKTPEWFGWVSYAYTRSMRDDPNRADNSLRPYILDQPHALTALASYSLGRSWKFGARLRFMSGNPYTPVSGKYFDADGQRFRPIDGQILSERLPAFLQLDIRIDKSWPTSLGTVSLFLDVQNVTNHENPEGVSYAYDYSSLEYTRGLPVFPSIGVSITP